MSQLKEDFVELIAAYIDDSVALGKNLAVSGDIPKEAGVKYWEDCTCGSTDYNLFLEDLHLCKQDYSPVASTALEITQQEPDVLLTEFLQAYIFRERDQELESYIPAEVTAHFLALATVAQACRSISSEDARSELPAYVATLFNIATINMGQVRALLDEESFLSDNEIMRIELAMSSMANMIWNEGCDALQSKYTVGSFGELNRLNNDLQIEFSVTARGADDAPDAKELRDALVQILMKTVKNKIEEIETFEEIKATVAA